MDWEDDWSEDYGAGDELDEDIFDDTSRTRATMTSLMGDDDSYATVNSVMGDNESDWFEDYDQGDDELDED